VFWSFERERKIIINIELRLAGELPGIYIYIYRSLELLWGGLGWGV